MMTTAVNHYFCSSIGRKHLVAVTGLLLCGFLVAHLSGNFLLLLGPDAFNLYGHRLVSMGGLLYVAEAGLLLIFLVHLGLATKLTLENLQARGKYQVKKKSGRGTTIMSASMPLTGLVLLVFTLLHLLSLKFGAHYETTVDGETVRDLYRLTLEYFQNPVNVAWYVFAMACAALHTMHGFSSAFQSLGLNHARYYSKIKIIGHLYGVLVGGGFAFLSIWAHFKGV